MVEPIMVITNNPTCREKLSDRYEIDFIDGSAMDVLKKARDYIHKNHRLLTHPLVSGVKPNEVPYRTVIISKTTENTVDVESLNYIEMGIHTTQKFLRDYGVSHWSKKVLDDFSVVDYDLIRYNL
ncbi:MAG TPA: GrdX protein [Clostridium sp.]|nr:GrdX family protein [uncultured Clostridium sp.]NLU07808.1 GrdX protein [Clostridiales bacterium]HBC96502.1 GrdX protein [Clostridium sp.]